MLHAAGSLVFGQPTPEGEWPHCAAGGAGWLGRAQRPPRCLQVALWLPPAAPPATPPAVPAASPVAAPRRGEATLYEDDGWSDAYRRGESSTQRASWAWEATGAAAGAASGTVAGAAAGTEVGAAEAEAEAGAEAAGAAAGAAADVMLRVRLEPTQGCFAHTALADAAEPLQPQPTPEEQGNGRPRSWRLLLHGVPPPTRLQLWRGGGGAAVRANESAGLWPEGAWGLRSRRVGHGRVVVVELPFAPPATRERWRRADARVPHWGFDGSRRARRRRSFSSRVVVVLK